MQPDCWGRGAWCLEELGSQRRTPKGCLREYQLMWTELEKMRVVDVGVLDGARGSCCREEVQRQMSHYKTNAI